MNANEIKAAVKKHFSPRIIELNDFIVLAKNLRAKGYDADTKNIGEAVDALDW